ncbi:MAG: hypothetical protein LBS05_05105 [Tannerellaceae bacterium]|jgi:O-antigen/teichoic acid export membrane protein|nr:hypothetical protein [Tannerellaceae bacterium]
MNKNEKETDWLKLLFSRLPEEDLNASFCNDTMKRILKEAARKKRRNEFMGLAAVSLASLAIMGIAAGAIFYAGIPRIEWRMPDLPSLPFYLYIGVLSLLLLGMDFLLRRAYRKRHPL